MYTQQAGRKPALNQNWQSSEKSQNFKEKTQFLMNSLEGPKSPIVDEKSGRPKKYRSARLYIFIKFFLKLESHKFSQLNWLKKREIGLYTDSLGPAGANLKNCAFRCEVYLYNLYLLSLSMSVCLSVVFGLSFYLAEQVGERKFSILSGQFKQVPLAFESFLP